MQTSTQTSATRRRTMPEAAARAIVADIAARGAVAIEEHGAEECNRARYTLRAAIAERQAERARKDGASAKAEARRSRGAYIELAREAEAASRRYYRAAARYTRTATAARLSTR